MAGAALRVRSLTKTFITPTGFLKPPHRHVALSDVSIDVMPSDILAVVGESGSGKSTLGRIIVGLLGADSGSIQLHGETLLDVRQRVCMPAPKRGMA